ncbi:hypothetical protein N7461_008144 [Penicillium sp. DV-2018c]|nr:hypothetical protein N7461_008144 [Penicillium sp. DV-2018c]
MCHSVSWYYGRCQHPDPEAASTIWCKNAWRKGYECIGEHLKEYPLVLKGYCLGCKLNALKLRQSIIRSWKRRFYRPAMNGAFRYHQRDWTVDDSEDEEYATETPAAHSPDLSRRSPTEQSEDGVSFYNAPASQPTLVQPTSPHSSCSALVEYADEEEDSDLELAVQNVPGEGIQTCRSRIPLPSTLLWGRQSPSFSELVSDDDMSDTQPLLGTPGPCKGRSRLPLPSRLLLIGRKSPSFAGLVSDDEMSDAEPVQGTLGSRKCSGRQSRIPLPKGMVRRT